MHPAQWLGIAYVSSFAYHSFVDQQEYERRELHKFVTLIKCAEREYETDRI